MTRVRKNVNSNAEDDTKEQDAQVRQAALTTYKHPGPTHQPIPLRVHIWPRPRIFTERDFSELARVHIIKRQRIGESLPMIRSDSLWELHHNVKHTHYIQPDHKRKYHAAIVKLAEQLLIGNSDANKRPSLQIRS